MSEKSEKRQCENVLRGISRNAVAAHRRNAATSRIQQTNAAAKKSTVIVRFVPLHERES